MVNQQLFDYIKQQLQQGVSKEQIKNSLIAKGWPAQDIDEVFSIVSNPINESSSVPPPAPITSSLPGPTVIFGQAWTIYKQRLGTFLGVMAIPMLIIIAYSRLAVSSIILFIPLTILFFVIISISQVWGQTALLYAIKDSHEKIGIIELYRKL